LREMSAGAARGMNGTVKTERFECVEFRSPAWGAIRRAEAEWEAANPGKMLGRLLSQSQNVMTGEWRVMYAVWLKGKSPAAE
jgi:hypothetical protein